jgi:serine/threonine-protein kinase HipA
VKLSVYVLGRDVAVLEPAGDFRSVLSYRPDVATDHFVSLTMPVRTESYTWDDVLPPIFQMNLPEGYLLQILQEQLGPVVTGSPMALLAVVGRNMVGRIQVAAPGANLKEVVKPVELTALLQGDNSEEAFAELVRQHATSGVSGVVPKFLDAQREQHNKATLLTRRHIIKGSTGRLPYLSLNEHLCMQVTARVLPSARTEISDDGKALVVHRFDVNADGLPNRGMEDFCALLGLRPANKYDTTWERIAKSVRAHVPGNRQYDTFTQLARLLLLTYALRNSDCHAKNISLLYTNRADVQLSPAYDMITTTIYEGYQHNPPGISFMGRKTWTPGKTLATFIAATFGIALKEQLKIVEQISDAVAGVAPRVREAMTQHAAFRELGTRILQTWNEGVSGLRERKLYSLGAWKTGKAFEDLAEVPKLAMARKVMGRSEGLAKRKRKATRAKMGK